ncbi:tRNA (guanosine(46)-N7)-methyltransferase TrmB [Streptomyces sp. SID3343]|uniref:tRNA (guanosine(46)-N7)-methyltransferase TrmB n=1 Tax=Streptomyces sp. SID3343 TaxID=2690260 RepID=UPI00136FCAAF|nr:tRNA (guanosine(46)-N7)-methyltransferase TrmB [Streptomyces sp. SID3343]MYW05156.1 tRNA (guanosine(46)-N7)-methyltransferase TrmB [Streptomyces sp. SID3343]
MSPIHTSPVPGASTHAGASTTDGPVRHMATVRSFTPRRGRITLAQREALDRLWERWGFDVAARTIDLGDVFGNERPVVLEIGFGMGETTAAMAAADPDTNVLAIDVHTPGQGSLLYDAELRGLTNIRVVNGDAVELLRDMLPPACLAGIRVFFSDPWPKTRHHKRRLIQPEFAALAASRLVPGGTLHCATDWAHYAEWMLEVLAAEPALVNTTDGYLPRPAWRPITRFEQQGLDKGHEVADLIFRRR